MIVAHALKDECMMWLYDFLKKILDVFSSECYIRVHWKLYCPGCGGTRAFLALMQGDVIQSLKYNPITLLFILDVLMTTILCKIEKRNEECSTAKIRMMINSIFLMFIVIFSILRNCLLYGLGIDMLGDFK